MKKLLFILLTFLLLIVLAFLSYDIDFSNKFVVAGRMERLVALILVSISISYSTVVFQTISANKILTPSLMGYEYLYVFSQVLLLLIFGGNSLFFRSKELSFIFASSIMIVYSLVLYRVFFKRNKKNVYFILLIGLVLGIFFNTSTQFLQMIINPNEFGYIQGAMFSSLSRISIKTISIAIVTILIVIIYLSRFFKFLDILVLGREYSMGLGVDYDKIARNQLIAISVLIAVSTALIGPITFIGVFISNISYRLTNTYLHHRTITVAFFITAMFMLAAQFVIEHILNYRHSLGVLINLAGGLYFILLILRTLRTKK
ncbi:iron chelate uptake ABC transporter family permease subunit [Sphingobacterium paludis]|uniref:Iron complex transport system permease protein n=1 Tax=Sphingobacterium paludis TaxID=1476465 RepID=A0A4R7D0S4_9SPHI|nr:iron chelate uptake ABC transporter family permease subunit [Sphingobacterium paludis]TDS13095.1 iron complex transport system permease protein [Sphingobacterium paludis]